MDPLDGGIIELLDAGFQIVRGALVAEHQIEQPAEYRHSRDQQHPAELIGRVGLAGDHPDGHTHAEHQQQRVGIDQMSLQRDQQRHQECQLQEDEHAHNDHPAEQEAQDLAQGYFLTQGASGHASVYCACSWGTLLFPEIVIREYNFSYNFRIPPLFDKINPIPCKYSQGVSVLCEL